MLFFFLYLQDKQISLHRAASKGDKDTVTLLLDHGANIDAQDQVRTTVEVGSNPGILWLLYIRVHVVPFR